MKNHGGRFFLILLVLAVAAWAWFTGGVRYGLDLAGGASLTYRVGFPESTTDKKERTNKLVEVLDKRLNAAGLGGISITATESDEVVIEIPGRSKDQIVGIKRLIEANGQLAFRILVDSATTLTERERRETLGGMYKPSDERFAWFPDAEGGPDILVYEEERPLKLEIEKLQARKEAGGQINEDEYKDKQREFNDLSDREVFSGDDLQETSVARPTIEIVVFFKMRAERRGHFGDFTERAVDKQMAIILDGKVESAPVINEKLPGQGQISGGGGGFNEQEARELSIVLESGATGVQLGLEREELLGPGLGTEAIQTGKLSILLGFIAVLITMFWLYRGPGLIANIALVMNVVLLVGALAFFRASLTLAGIAGIVLTLGMAVDANILIFERLREERDRGKSLIESVAAGYDRALVAIIDANVTTVLTAIVLIVKGSGTVRGFGVTLTIGILASMFTAIFVTRAIFEWSIEKGIMKHFTFGRDRKPFAIDFMARRRFFTGPSLVAVIVGAAFFMSRPAAESKDLEFLGGEEVIVQVQEPLAESVVTDLVTAGGTRYAGAQPVALEARGVEVVEPETTNRWRVRVPLETKEEGEQFVTDVEEAFADKLLSVGLTDFTTQAESEGSKAEVSFVLHAIDLPDGVGATEIKDALAGYLEEGKPAAFTLVEVIPQPDDANAFAVTATAADANEVFVKDKARLALQAMDTPVFLSDPMPSVAFLNPGRAQQLWRSALQAVLIAMLLQVIYIRMRFADFKHGFAAVCALVHDVAIALGTVAVCDAMGLVHAKVNLVLIAAFLTLIGYSMNDTIVVFDRIRENMGKSRVIRTKTVNNAINQTLARSIRTSITTWVVVLIQFALNYRSGSVLEGFAFVMCVGVISGTYSSIFIAGPLLLFLPDYWRKLSASRPRLWIQVLLTIVGTVVAMKADAQAYVIAGMLCAANIPLHFLIHFVPWLGLDEPDELLQTEIAEEERKRPIRKPGI